MWELVGVLRKQEAKSSLTLGVGGRRWSLRSVGKVGNGRFAEREGTRVGDTASLPGTTELVVMAMPTF